MKKNLNKRCPLQVECERKCEYEGRELACDYYEVNAREDLVIEDQEELRRERDRKRDEEYYEEQLAALDEQARMVYIDAEQLYPHPRNPRKSLGDLTELADSIRVNGIFQNLTVVQGHYMTKDEYVAMARAEGVSKVNALGTYEAEGTYSPEGYTVIIGHRRLAGAKLAGLDELPCVVVEMDEKEQVRTMLLENMQRSDLTTYEQAQGFQMMLDMGDTVDEIAEKSGFSKTTVRRRVKLLDLDQEKFKRADERGATLFDYAELDKIKSAELKNRVLDAVGTANFRDELRKAIEEEKNAEFIAARVAEISEWATEITETSWQTHTYIRNYGLWNWKKDSVVERPEDADTVKYYYKVGRQQVDIYTDKVEQQDSEEDLRREAARRAAERKEEELERITERHFNLRMEFVAGFGAAKKHIAEICQYAAVELAGDGVYCRDEIDAVLLGEILEMEVDDNTDYPTFKAMIDTAAAERPEYVLLACAYVSSDDDANGYFTSQYNSGVGAREFIHQGNDDLDRLYELLISLGYEMSDEEKAMQDGTHEAFSGNTPDAETAQEKDPCDLCKAAHPDCDKCCNTCNDPCNAGQMCRKAVDA